MTLIKNDKNINLHSVKLRNFKAIVEGLILYIADEEENIIFGVNDDLNMAETATFMRRNQYDSMIQKLGEIRLDLQRWMVENEG